MGRHFFRFLSTVRKLLGNPDVLFTEIANENARYVHSTDRMENPPPLEINARRDRSRNYFGKQVTNEHYGYRLMLVTRTAI